MQPACGQCVAVRVLSFPRADKGLFSVYLMTIIDHLILKLLINVGILQVLRFDF